jgi:hypothetical protein
LRKDQLDLFIRSARDKEHISTHDRPFDSITLSLNEADTREIDWQFRNRLILGTNYVSKLQEALRTFRGTLIDGNLQPNVRLGNGLDVLGLPFPVKRDRKERGGGAFALEVQPDAERTELQTVPNDPVRDAGVRVKEDIELDAQALKARPSPHTESKAYPEFSSQEHRLREVVLNLREAGLNSREEALQKREKTLKFKEKRLKKNVETLLWKRGTVEKMAWHRFGIPTRRQRLTQRHPESLGSSRADRSYTATVEPQNASFSEPWLSSTGDPIPSNQSTETVRHSRSPPSTSAREPDTPPEMQPKPSTMNDLPPRPHVENTGDLFPSDEFNLNEPTPPPALATLRARHAMLGRRRRGR